MSGRSRESIQRELKTRYRNLDELQERQAKFGINAPLDLINQIHDERQAIADLEEELKHAVAETPADAAPLAVDKRGRGSAIQTLDDRDWDNLLRRIKDGNCTPFLGP